MKMSSRFYHAFENIHRGSRELIRGRLSAYLPFIEPLREFCQPPSALDLGCGRGEWLELLQDNNFLPHGVDLDAGMLADCVARGLPVTQGDAIEHLKQLADESQCIVSGFHIAEHLPFDVLNILVQQALRVLKPGGLLILETPNPENVVVGSSSFYLDPTHLRPIPPPLLSFLPEYHGFARVRIVRLQESADIHQRSDICIMDVLGGVSPDYAVVAQKAASPGVMARLDAPFAAHFGIELHELAERYDGILSQRMNAIEQRLANAEAKAQQSEAKVLEVADCYDGMLNQRMNAIEQRLANAEVQAQQSEAKVLELMQRVAQAEACAVKPESAMHQKLQQANEGHERLLAISNRKSWKITAPIRILGRIVPRESLISEISTIIVTKLKQIVRAPVISTIKSAGNRAQSSPGFKRFALRLLRGHPSVQQKILKIYLENKSKGQPQPENWSGIPINAVKPSPLDISDGKEFVVKLPPSQGINANQRSPLEVNFNTYRGQP